MTLTRRSPARLSLLVALMTAVLACTARANASEPNPRRWRIDARLPTGNPPPPNAPPNRLRVEDDFVGTLAASSGTLGGFSRAAEPSFPSSDPVAREASARPKKSRRALDAADGAADAAFASSSTPRFAFFPPGASSPSA